MSNIISPNMNLIIPIVGSEAGPTYASDINNSLTLLDQHDHSLGKGLQITPAGLNINTALTLQNNALTNINSLVFTNQTSGIATGQALYVAPGSESPVPLPDLWYNDGSNPPIQLTSGGLVNATIASIPGESYAGGTFTWRQGTGSTTPANMDIGSVILRPNTAGTTNGVVLNPPAAVSSQFSLFLPTIPSGSTSFLLLDTSGNMNSTSAVFPLTASSIANNTITAAQIANNTITATQIANDTITTTQISDSAGITLGQLAAPNDRGGFTSGSSYSNGTGSYTTAITGQMISNPILGRPVMVYLTAFSDGYIEISNPGGVSNATIAFQISKQSGGTILNQSTLTVTSTGAFQMPPGCLNFVDIVNSFDVTNAQITYTLSARVVSGSSVGVAISNVNMNAWML